MSHFTVGIIVKNKEDLEFRLARYAEQDPDYYEKMPYMTKEEYIKLYKEYHKDMDFTNITDEEIWRTKAPEEYNSDEIDLDGGMIYTYYNPDAKWDWYEIGGRWSNELIISPTASYIHGGHYGQPVATNLTDGFNHGDGAKIKDILWDKMNEIKPEDVERLTDFWDGYVLGNNPDKDYGFVMYKPEYYLERYKDKETYIKNVNTFRTHSLLFCPEDDFEDWLEAGEMGWFGMDSSNGDSEKEYYNRFDEIIKDPRYQDYWFVVVDCHI